MFCGQAVGLLLLCTCIACLYISNVQGTVLVSQRVGLSTATVTVDHTQLCNHHTAVQSAEPCGHLSAPATVSLVSFLVPPVDTEHLVHVINVQHSSYG